MGLNSGALRVACRAPSPLTNRAGRAAFSRWQHDIKAATTGRMRAPPAGVWSTRPSPPGLKPLETDKMAAATVLGQLAAARLEIDRAGELLTSPSPRALDRCSSVLEARARPLPEWHPR